jgi:hypothetical protein
MREEVGCGLSHVVSDDHLIANIQVGKQSARGDDQVERTRNAREQTRMFGESHGLCCHPTRIRRHLATYSCRMEAV